MKRIKELDALRGIAAFGVVCWHYSGHFHAQPLGWLFKPFYSAGPYLVDFFFVLSGFVLSRAYCNGRQKRWLENIVRRVARIVPLHWVSLLLVVIGQWAYATLHQGKFFAYQFNDLYHFILNVLLLNQLGWERGYSFNGPSWSISTEFYVNLLFFTLIALLSRFWMAMAGLVVMSFLGLLFAGNGLDTGNTVFGFDGALVRTAFGFFVGCMFYVLSAKYQGMLEGAQKYFYDVIFVLIVLVLSIASVRSEWAVPLFDFLVVLLLFPGLMVCALRGRLASRGLCLRPLVYLGDVSYSIYLLHFPVQLLFVLVMTMGWVAFDYTAWWMFLIYFAVVLLCAAGSYHVIEIPIQRWMVQKWLARGSVKGVVSDT